ncbi:hypothetical protein [Ideonella sp.]|uniref:hypothetical protein n=1 Tax=Ideonella sp. TaxID=1929293 RepID=UPI0035B3A906
MTAPRTLETGQRGHSLPSCVADALRLRCAALDETLRQRCGPDLMLALLKDLERLTRELQAAQDAQTLLDRVRYRPGWHTG